MCTESPSEDSSRSHGLNMLNARGFLLHGLYNNRSMPNPCLRKPPIAPVRHVSAPIKPATEQRPLNYRQLLVSRAMMSANSDQVSRFTWGNVKDLFCCLSIMALIAKIRVIIYIHSILYSGYIFSFLFIFSFLRYGGRHMHPYCTPPRSCSLQSTVTFPSNVNVSCRSRMSLYPALRQSPSQTRLSLQARTSGGVQSCASFRRRSKGENWTGSPPSITIKEIL
jgi:hypothetical protein